MHQIAIGLDELQKTERIVDFVIHGIERLALMGVGSVVFKYDGYLHYLVPLVLFRDSGFGRISAFSTCAIFKDWYK